MGAWQEGEWHVGAWHEGCGRWWVWPGLHRGPLSCSKNSCGYAGLAEVVKALAYSPSIEELLLTDLKLSGGSTAALAEALKKLFNLSVSLKKACNCCV